MSDMMIKNTLVKVKEHPPYLGDMEGKVLLNSMARATFDPKTGEYSFKGKLSTEVPADVSNATTVSNMVAAGGLADPSCESFSGIGVDQGRYRPCHCSDIYTQTIVSELISAVPSHNPTFVSRNFTDAEAEYCHAQPSPPSSFAARWAGKEAVFKSLGVKSKGAAASLRDIEILNDPETGAPTVTLHGDAKAKADEAGIVKVLISLSHSEVSIDLLLVDIEFIRYPAVRRDCLCPSFEVVLRHYTLAAYSFTSHSRSHIPLTTAIRINTFLTHL
jgi:fatty acid synthase subunit beta